MNIELFILFILTPYHGLEMLKKLGASENEIETFSKDHEKISEWT